MQRGVMAFGNPIKYVPLDIRDTAAYNDAIKEGNAEFAQQPVLMP
jgi:hypothetical protein